MRTKDLCKLAKDKMTQLPLQVLDVPIEMRNEDAPCEQAMKIVNEVLPSQEKRQFSSHGIEMYDEHSL